MVPSKKHINFALKEDSLEQDINPIDLVVQNIKGYSQQNGNLFEKYNEQFYLTYFDRNVIQRTVVRLGAEQNQKKELKLEEFIRSFLGFIEHKEQQTLFLAMSLRNIFLKIKQTTNNQIGIKFGDFTNFLCQRIAKQNPDLIVPLKQIPQQKINPDVSRIRQIDINPPLVLKNSESDLPRIAKQKKKKDRKLIERKPVSKFIYNFATNQIITVGRLSSCIHFYDMQLKKQKVQIQPKTYNEGSRQIAILSMDFDQVNQRIGAIINGMGIAFWQASDNFDTQKVISKYQGQKIFYLGLFKEWITADKNTIYFWDLKEEAVSKKIHNEQAVMVNDVCQINHLRFICVSYTTFDNKKPFVIYKGTKQIARYEMGSSGCHSLHYNVPSQMIITAGYHNQLQVFEVQNRTYSINLKKQLKGHTSIVTCVSDIRNTNYILSGDDSGEVRIWELNFMKCIQVVKVSKYINQLYCTWQKLIFTDSRLNTMQMDKFSLPYMSDEQIIYHFFEQQSQIQFAITRKSIRRINFLNGRIEMIFVVCEQEEEISSAIKISSGILIGTSKGNMKLYTTEGKNKWHVLAHEGQISQLRYDRKTRFIFSLGADNKLMIWPQKSIVQDGAKKIITFKNKNFNLLTLFNQVRLLFLGSTEENQVSVWDYENLKLLTVIKLTSPILFMDINPLYRILMVSTINDQLCMFKLIWKNGYLDYQIMYDGDSAFSGLKKSKKVNYQTSFNQQSSLNNLEYQQGIISQAKKGKTPKQTSSKCQLNSPDINEKIELFVTSTNVQNIEQSTFKKSSIKISTFNLNSCKNNQQEKTVLPSIKLIQLQKRNSLIDEGDQTLGTLKTLKKIDNEITTRMEIKETQQSTLLVLGNSKGQISCFNITSLIKDQFSDYETQLKKNQSPHMYRPAKEDYDLQISKQNFSTLTLETMPKISRVKKSYFKLSWKQSCPNKEPIFCFDFIEMKNVYLCASMTDGCCKYFDLQTGALKGHLKMDLPLPINWEVKIQKDLYIRRNVYQTLVVLDNILSNHGFQMLSKQYQSINVTKFLQMLKQKKTIKQKISSKTKIESSKCQNQNKKITLLNQEYSIQDIKKITYGIPQAATKENTLKSLEAYKRVKQIKDQMKLEVQNSSEQKPDDGIQKVSSEILRQKQEIQKLFAVNYFSVLGEHGVSNRKNKYVQLGSLQERSILLLEKLKQNKKKMSSQYSGNKLCENRPKRQASLLPTINSTIRSQVIETKKIEQDAGRENTLVGKLTNSLSTVVSSTKQKNVELVSIYENSSLTSSVLKNVSSISVNNSKVNPSYRLTQSKTLLVQSDKENLLKFSNLKGLTKKHNLEEKSTRQILSQINEKLQKYKKSNYSKRQII